MYQLEVFYPSPMFGPMDDAIIRAVGRLSDSCGSGINGKRDMQFLFNDLFEMDSAAKRVADLGLRRVSCVQGRCD